MNIPEEVISALIGAVSALAVVLIKDIVGDTVRNRRARRRELVRQRLEDVYVPLNYLMYALATCDEGDASNIGAEILQILKKHGHLLTKQTLSGLYVSVDPSSQMEIETSLVERFFQEYQSLREAFYKDRSSSPSITITQV